VVAEKGDFLNIEPLVTCFLPIRNAEKYLEAWWRVNGPELASVNALLLIVDNGSNDRSLEIVHGFNYKFIKIITHGENRGIEQSFKTAKSHIHSKYRFFLPADDLLCPGYLASALDVMENFFEVQVVYGKSYMYNFETKEKSLRQTPYRRVGLHREGPFFPLFFNNSIPDISLYRSTSLDVSPDSTNWFLPGLQSSVLLSGTTYFTGADQCVSGKGQHQLSRNWTISGRYYSFLMENYNALASEHFRAFSDQILWSHFLSFFHTGTSLMRSSQLLTTSGHPYVRQVMESCKTEIYSMITLLLVDELLVDPVGAKFKEQGRFGTLKDLIDCFNLVPRSHNENLTEELSRRNITLG